MYSVNDYCRLCGEKDRANVPVFEDVGLSYCLQLKILHNLNVLISRRDPFSKNVCLLCFGKLDFFLKFRDGCRNVQISIRKELYTTRSSNASGTAEGIIGHGIVNDASFAPRKHNQSVHENWSYVNAGTANSPLDESVSAGMMNDTSSEDGSVYASDTECVLDTSGVKIPDSVSSCDVENEVDGSEFTGSTDNLPIESTISHYSTNMETVDCAKNAPEMTKSSDLNHYTSKSITEKNANDQGNVKAVCSFSVMNENNNSNSPNDTSLGEPSVSIDNDFQVSAPIENLNECLVINEDNRVHNLKQNEMNDLVNATESRVIAAESEGLDSIEKILDVTVSAHKYLNENNADTFRFNTVSIFQHAEDLVTGKRSLMPYLQMVTNDSGERWLLFKCFVCSRSLKSMSRRGIMLHFWEHLHCICNFCDRRFFRTKTAFSIHTREHHGFQLENKALKCCYCVETFNDMTCYFKHLVVHYKDHCGICSWNTTTDLSLTAHMKKKHMSGGPGCCYTDCSLAFNNLEQLNRHVNEIKSNFICKSCELPFHSESLVRLHNELFGTSHKVILISSSGVVINNSNEATTSILVQDALEKNNSSKEISCKDFCDTKGRPKSASIIQYFRDILAGKVPPDKYKSLSCPFCMIRIRRSVTLTSKGERVFHQHIENHLIKTCFRCSRIFDDFRLFEKHLTRHDNPNLTCFVCDKTFQRVSDYMSHVRLHCTRKLCFYCKMNLGDIPIEAHVRKMHKDKYEELKKSICDKCGARFRGNSQLKEHISFKHEGLKKSQRLCEKCGKKLPGLSCKNCNKFVANFICDYCSKGFSMKQALISHILVHMNEQRFKCKLCGRKFNRATSLNKHMKDMHNERRWHCTYTECGASFTFKSALRKHVENHQ